MNNLINPEVKAKSGKCEKLVVFLHGLGSDGNDLIALAPYFQAEFPNFHFFSPHAVEAFDMAPFGRQWFSLQDRTPAVIMKLVEKNTPKINEIISAKQQELNLTNKDTIIIGFSQGAMIGIYLTLLQDKEAFAAMIGFSGRLLAPPICLNFLTPICLIHGNEDDIVEVVEMENTKNYLNFCQIKCETHKLYNLGHTIDHRGLELSLNFLKNIL